MATVIDCHTRKVIGYAMADHYRADLIVEAIERAVVNMELPKGAIFHSDRGSNARRRTSLARWLVWA